MERAVEFIMDGSMDSDELSPIIYYTYSRRTIRCSISVEKIIFNLVINIEMTDLESILF